MTAAMAAMARLPRPESQREPIIGRDAYLAQLVDLLFERLLEVVRVRQPEIEATLTIAPPPRRRRCGTASRVMRTI